MRKFVLILVSIVIICCLGSAPAGIAFAASKTEYTGVLVDLGKDKTFNANKYPTRATADKPFEVIQIAEGVDKELFVYVYQPLEDKFTASEIRISTTAENVAPHDYPLKLLDRSGTLAKYKVNGFVVSSEAQRFYYIIQIARPWDKNVDKETGNDNEVSTVACAVGKQFRATTVGADVTYTETHEDVIEITAKYCGYIRNFAGWLGIASEHTDSHFIAFDTDVVIDKLMEATVTYDQIVYSEKVVTIGGLTMPGSYKEYPDTEAIGIEAKLKAEKEVQTPTIGWFGKEYVWNEIQSVDDFLELEEVTDGVRQEVEGKQWVLRFALTEVADKYPAGVVLPATFDRYAYKVSNATILRLKFITNGVTYDLGAVDNKQTEGDSPSNPNPDRNLEETIKSISDFFKTVADTFKNLSQWLKQNWWVIIVGIVGIGVIIGLIVAFIKFGFKIVMKAIGYAIWFLIKGLALLIWTVLKLTIFLPVTLAVKKRKDG